MTSLKRCGYCWLRKRMHLAWHVDVPWMLNSFLLSISISRRSSGVCRPNGSRWWGPPTLAVVNLCHSPQWALLLTAQVILLKGQSCPGARYTEEPPCKISFPRPFAKQCWFPRSLLAFLQPNILDFCALVSTLVEGWAALLRGLNCFSLTLSRQPGITPKPT